MVVMWLRAYSYASSVPMLQERMHARVFLVLSEKRKLCLLTVYRFLFTCQFTSDREAA